MLLTSDILRPKFEAALSYADFVAKHRDAILAAME